MESNIWASINLDDESFWDHIPADRWIKITNLTRSADSERWRIENGTND